MCYVRYTESSRRLRTSGKSSWEITEPLTTGLSRRVYREIRAELAQVHGCRGKVWVDPGKHPGPGQTNILVQEVKVIGSWGWWYRTAVPASYKSEADRLEV